MKCGREKCIATLILWFVELEGFLMEVAAIGMLVAVFFALAIGFRNLMGD